MARVDFFSQIHVGTPGEHLPTTFEQLHKFPLMLISWHAVGTREKKWHACRIFKNQWHAWIFFQKHVHIHVVNMCDQFYGEIIFFSKCLFSKTAFFGPKWLKSG